ncbi:MAG: 1,4-dihydroxy-6-naphthoate synthase [Dehalococcoidia bacterium]|nr:1,4-dihydroxy-6-naphthoate synthase [Dehalococcoidia bacterium]
MTWTAWEKGSPHDFAHIIYEKKWIKENGAGVARITINKPQKLNAFTNEGLREMMLAFENASHDRMIGVATLQGMGDRAFSSGGDVEWESDENYRQNFYYMVPVQKMLRLCRKPIIAVVRGYAIGGGNHLAYSCDFTIAADNAIFGQNGPRIGSPADGYYVAYLTRVIGAKRAREMWMLCRRYTAQQALDMGLCNAVAPLDKLDAEVDKWCEEILAMNPQCIEILKATFDAELAQLEGAAGPQGTWSSLMYPNHFGSPDVAEAQKAFFEKRKPDFWQFRRAEVEAAKKK